MKLNRLSYIGMAASAAMLVSCAGNEPAFDAPGRAVHMSVDISRDQAGTRATLTETDGDLSIAWEQNDNILVTDATGAKLGVLTLTTGAGTETARFEGTIKTQLSGAADLNLLYLGRKTVDELAALPSPVAVDFSNQQGTLASLSDNDFFSSTVNARIEGSVATTGDVTMERKTAFAHFTLKFPDGVVMDENTTVSISGEGVYNTASVSMSNGVRFSAEGDGTLTVGNGADFYVTILPGEESITPTFRATAGGKAYKATLASRVWTAGEFVRESHETGIPVLMEVDNDAFTDPYPDEDPRNPLHKFAKYNLTRVDGLTNGFAAEGDNGALYQWGRNYGFVDNKGIYTNTQQLYIPNDDFINYADAQGYMTYDLDKGISMADFYAYRESGTYPDYSLSSATGMHYRQSIGLFFDRPYSYNSAEEIAAHPDKYFMDATPNGRIEGYGSLAEGMEWNRNRPDYWISTFGDGGNRWAERASKCGYDNTNPCPDGWRLPTLEEFRAIAPEGDGFNGTSSLQTLLNNNGQVREHAGVRYAIRWIYNTDYIQIEAVVIDNTYTESSQLTSLFWDQHKTDKVVRTFPYTGIITPLIMLGDGAMHTKYELVVRPFHRGEPMRDIGLLTVGYYNERYFVVDPEDYKRANAALGGYWIDEKGWAFKFVAKEKSVDTQSCLLVEEAEPVSAYAIRPVMDKK